MKPAKQLARLLLVSLLAALSCAEPIVASLSVYNEESNTTYVFEAVYAQFGPHGSFDGELRIANPLDSCDAPLQNPVEPDYPVPVIFIIERANRPGRPCSFVDQVSTVQNAGGSGAIVFDRKPNDFLIVMTKDEPRSSESTENVTTSLSIDMAYLNISIPSVFITFSSGRFIYSMIDNVQGPDPPVCLVEPLQSLKNGPEDKSFRFSSNFLWLVVGACAMTGVALMGSCYLLVQRRRMTVHTFRPESRFLFGRVNSTAKERIGLLPTETFVAPEQQSSAAPSVEQAAESSNTLQGNEMCSICLEEFRNGDTLRLLPDCKHRFHCACIDKWLVERASYCPLCMRVPAILGGKRTVPAADTSSIVDDTDEVVVMLPNTPVNEHYTIVSTDTNNAQDEEEGIELAVSSAARDEENALLLTQTRSSQSV